MNEPAQALFAIYAWAWFLFVPLVAWKVALARRLLRLETGDALALAAGSHVAGTLLGGPLGALSAGAGLWLLGRALPGRVPEAPRRAAMNWLAMLGPHQWAALLCAFCFSFALLADVMVGLSLLRAGRCRPLARDEGNPSVRLTLWALACEIPIWIALAWWLLQR